MTRNMIGANSNLFLHLDDICAGYEEPIRNAGRRRYISTNAGEKTFLINSILCERLDFSPARKLARFEYDKTSTFVTIGLDSPKLSRGSEVDVHAGHLTVALSELKPKPKASALQIRDIVEAGDMDDVDYQGHEAGAIADLFPSVRAFDIEDLDPTECYRAFFQLCLSECIAGDVWLNKTLGDSLEALSDLGPTPLPYNTLCRSIFDSDPGALFLSLYRCLEAIYSYASATKVKDALNIETSWFDLAVVLEDRLGWHPHEESSLKSLFEYGTEHDFLNIMTALGEQGQHDAQTVARRVYRLRNSLVHFRPAQHLIDYSLINWNLLCEGLTGIVCFAYNNV